jgi:hypothetical protein
MSKQPKPGAGGAGLGEPVVITGGDTGSPTPPETALQAPAGRVTHHPGGYLPIGAIQVGERHRRDLGEPGGSA